MDFTRFNLPAHVKSQQGSCLNWKEVPVLQQQVCAVVATAYIILVSFKHIGDYNQALQIQHLLQCIQPVPLDISLFDVESDSQLVLLPNKPLYLHSIGEKAMLFLVRADLLNKLGGCTVIVQIHQHFPQLAEIKPDFLIMPSATFRECEQLEQTRKLLLRGTVFQKLSPHDLQQLFFNSPIAKDITLEDHHLIVMLAGDAPDQDKMNVFSKESADLLLARIIYFFGCHRDHPYRVIVQNGPRTGKHDPLTKKEVCLHTYKEGEDSNLALDEVSKYFVSKLQQLEIPHLFYNFAFETLEKGRRIHSQYKALLYVAQSSKSAFFFPMESVSMCSELPYYIGTSRLFAYQTDSTNADHKRIVEEFYQRGLFNAFNGRNFRFEVNPYQRQDSFDEVQQLLPAIFEKETPKKDQPEGP